jgi:ADP-ribose pyrophosphatase YjhB (NUDIX family)
MDKKNKNHTVNNNYYRNYEVCNNCGKSGHLFHKCKLPITSIGIIAFRIFPTGDENDPYQIQYLLIRRKETLGYIDFMRGKYSVHNKDYIMNMLKQMTRDEKQQLTCGDFEKLWKNVWGDSIYSNQYRTEEIVSKEKYNQLFGKFSEASHGISNETQHERRGFTDRSMSELETKFVSRDTGGQCVKIMNLNNLIEESNKFETWEEPEWGFPKGRRNNQENDYECAIREFCEETGYPDEYLIHIQNIVPFEEIFTGSNYKSYKHKYFLMFMNYEKSLKYGDFQKSEVSKMEWKNLNECLMCFRPYNLEKIRIIKSIDTFLKKILA